MARRVIRVIGWIVVIVLLFLGAWAGGLLVTFPADYTKMVSYNIPFADSPSRGGGATNGGPCTSSPPSGPGGPGNLLDQSEYIASWAGNLMGQKVTVQGCILLSGLLGINKAKYVIQLEMPPDLGGIVTVVETPLTVPLVVIGDIINFESTSWELRHPDGTTVIPEGATIYARFMVETWDGIFKGDVWHVAAAQHSIIRSGIGIVNWEKPQYLVGETAIAHYQVGWISEQKADSGWTLFITSGAQGYATVKGPVAVTQTEGTISYVVTAADFSTSSPHNELIVRLRNQITTKSFDIGTTITQELLETAPTCEISGFEPGSPRQGQSVTVSFECTPADEEPDNQIKLIRVYWGYGDTSNQEDLAPDATSYTFTAGESGYLRLEIIAYTYLNVPSAATELNLNVDRQLPYGCGPGTNNLGCTNGGPPGIWVIAMIVGFVLLLVGLMWKGLPFPFRILFILVGALLLLLGIVFWVLPSVTAYIKGFKWL